MARYWDVLGRRSSAPTTAPVVVERTSGGVRGDWLLFNAETDQENMIARVWRGLVHSDKLEEYIDIVEETGMDEYRRTPGNLGAQILTRDLGEGRAEIITISWWPDVDHVRGFAGDDIEVAKYYLGRPLPDRPGRHRRPLQRRLDRPAARRSPVGFPRSVGIRRCP